MASIIEVSLLHLKIKKPPGREWAWWLGRGGNSADQEAATACFDLWVASLRVDDACRALSKTTVLRRSNG